MHTRGFGRRRQRSALVCDISKTIVQYSFRFFIRSIRSKCESLKFWKIHIRHFALIFNSVSFLCLQYRNTVYIICSDQSCHFLFQTIHDCWGGGHFAAINQRLKTAFSIAPILLFNVEIQFILLEYILNLTYYTHKFWYFNSRCLPIDLLPTVIFFTIAILYR